MGIGLDWINSLLIGALLLVVIVLLWDEFGAQLAPILRRYRARLMPGPVSWRTFLPLGIALMLALLMRRAVLISIYLIVVGGLLTLHSHRRIRDRQRLLAARNILQLVLAFRSTYQLQPSVFSTLERVKEKTDEPLKGLVDVMTQTFYLTSSPERAFAELRERTDNVYLQQFAYILEMIETARTDAVLNALDNLVERLRNHDELRRDTESSLISITGQTSVLQRIAMAIVVGVAVLPPLRAPYTSTIGQIVFIVLLTVILAGSYYIERSIGELVERIS